MTRNLVKRTLVSALGGFVITLCLSPVPLLAVPQEKENPPGKATVSQAQLDGWILSLQADDVFERRKAANDLAEAGPRGLPALPALIQALQDEDPQVAKASARAISSLGPAGKPALPVLARLLASDDDYLVYWVATAIGSIGGPDNREAVRQLLLRKSQKLGTPLIYNSYLESYPETSLEYLLAVMADSDPVVRRRAAEAIGWLVYYPRPEPLITLVPADRKRIQQALSPLRQDPNWDVRLAASTALIQLDPNQVENVAPTLIEGLRLGVDGARKTSTYLKKVPEFAIPRLLAGLVENRFSDPLDGTGALASMPAQSQDALRECLAHPSTALRLAAAQSLTGYGLRDYREEGTELLLPALQDTDPEVRLAAAESMVALATPQMAASVPALNDFLLDEQTDRRLRAAQALTRIGPEGQLSGENLRRNLDHPDADLRFASALALVAVEPSRAEKALPILRSAINDPTNRISQRIAVVAAGNLGRMSQPLADDIAALVEPADPTKNIALQVEAAEALIKIDPGRTEQAVHRLAEIVHGPSNKTTGLRLAIGALVRHPEVSRPAIPALEQSSQREKGPFRAQAAVALIKIDAANQQARWDFVIRNYWQVNKVSRNQVLSALLEYELVPSPLLPEIHAMLSDNTPRWELLKAIHLVGLCGSTAPSIPASVVGPCEREAAYLYGSFLFQ